MAQALLNNLNIAQENGFSINDNNMKTSALDFAKIFDSKTGSNNNKGNADNNTKNDTENSEQVNPEQSNNQNSIKQTLGDLKTKMNTEDTLNAEFKNAVLESVADTVVDLTITKEEIIEAAETDIADDASNTSANEDEDTKTENEPTTDELNPISEEIQEPIITEEDPTMYKELTTLENPTVAIMLHSQLQTTTNVVSDNNTETVSDENVSFVKTNDSSLNNTNIFKQFDNIQSENTPVNLPKEDLNVKSELSKLNKVLDDKFVKDLNVRVIESENESETFSNDLMQKQTPQEQVAKVMIQGDIKFDKLQFDVEKAVELKPTEISANKIIEQISKQLDGMYNNTKLNMVLNPGTLGKVNLHIINSKDGLVAQFTVTTQDAKELLMKGLNGLKESLLSQGISVDNVSVKLEEAKENENSSDWTEQQNSRGGYKQQGSQKQQKNKEKPFEQMMFELNNDGKV